MTNNEKKKPDTTSCSAVTDKLLGCHADHDILGAYHPEEEEEAGYTCWTNWQAGKKAGAAELVCYHELPDYMKENEFIHRYYRSEWPLRHAFLSLFRWHNETLSVWTHLVGFMVFLGLTLMHLRDVPVVADLLSGLNYWPFLKTSEGNFSKDPRSLYGGQSVVILGNPALSSEYLSPTAAAAPAPRWPFFVFLGGSMFCLLSSSMCHLLCCHSRRLNSVLWRLDYVGIAVMIVASFFPPIYYIFQCEPHWQWVYLGSISAMGALTISTLLSPHLCSGSFRIFRAMLFSGMAFTGIIPAVHATIVNWDEPQRPITLAYESAMAALYITGTLFYISRVPERWKPGFFDLTGHSHQIFHVFVVAGALAHYAAGLVFLEWRDRSGCGVF